MCLAIPGKVIEILAQNHDEMRMGKVSFGGIKKTINLHLVPEVELGDYVLVHVGVALSVVDEEEAKKTLSFLTEMGETMELQKDENQEQP
jgi:hydrogenase expression/formation protein HypC